jgi:hypothetical protein
VNRDEIIFLILISWSPSWLPNLHFDVAKMCELARPSPATTESLITDLPAVASAEAG